MVPSIPTQHGLILLRYTASTPARTHTDHNPGSIKIRDFVGFHQQRLTGAPPTTIAILSMSNLTAQTSEFTHRQQAIRWPYKTFVAKKRALHRGTPVRPLGRSARYSISRDVELLVRACITSAQCVPTPTSFLRQASSSSFFSGGKFQ